MGLFVGFLIFGTTALFAYAILSIFFSEERKVSKAMKQMSPGEAHQTMAAEPLLKPFQDRVLSPMANSLLTQAHKAGPTDLRDRIKRRLIMAGNPGGLDVDRFFSIKILSVLAVFAGIIALALFSAMGIRLTIFLLIVLVPLSFFVPDIWLRQIITNRKQSIRRKLPDALDMLTISVEAGLGFDAAIARLVKNMRNPLAVEFGRMLYETNAGTPRADALRHLAERTDVSELNSFVTSMVQADLFGVSIANTLKTQATEMRTRRRQRAEEQAQKAPVKLVFPLILCILPATLIVIGGPAVVSIGRGLGLIS